MTKEKWSKRDRSILDGIRREDITAAVQMIRSIDAIEWKRSEPNGKTTKDGEEICSMPYPNYPEGVFEILSLTGIDSEYDINYKKYCENVSIKDMGPAQIQTMLTWIQRGEHFCVGFLSERIENGELLALLCRLDEILIGDLLNKAISFAVEKHSGQFRKGTDIPYIVHPLEVMTILTAMRADPEVVTAGVLHDTVEDTDATIEQIESLFGARVAELVASHSEDKSKSWKERKEYAIEELRDATYEMYEWLPTDGGELFFCLLYFL